ncbi:glycosyltransferase family 2 protein [Mycetohabitans sp. B46]|uniref:glycosyltransferase family 2 protein n=1 Tax=Mycetohabitans sp. B46 TaxID=2772536 RepID=UPI00307F2FB0
MQANTHQLLQDIVWSTAEVGAPDALYFRATPRNAWRIRPESGAVWSGDPVEMDGTLDFSTFFGGFSLTTWCRECGLNGITLEIAFEGDALLTIWHDNGREPRQLLWSGDVEALPRTDSGHVHVNLSGLAGKSGLLYPEFQPTSPRFTLKSVRYMTDQPPRRKVRLAVVMPTFKREAYVRRSMALLERVIRANPAGAIELIVVDNGQTLGREAPSGIRIVPNRNYGGAGGFARGVLEALSEQDPFTHVLFCDDDIAVEPESYSRLFNLLHYVGDDRIVAGGMLNMQDKGKLHELGARVRGLRFWSVKGGADLTSQEDVIRYDEPEYATFYGWWFTCYPLAQLREKLMPFPFFVGFDDVEMGMRLSNEMSTVALTGIAVWHEEFHKKETNWRWYYHARNGLAANYMYVNNDRAVTDVFRQVLGALLTYRYERAANLLDGVHDAQKGPQFIRELVPDEFHAAKAKAQKQLMRPVSAMQFVSEKFAPKMTNSRLRKLLVMATLNGHLLPSFMMRRATNAFDDGWAIEPLHSMRLQTIFRKPTVLYYEPTIHQGLLCSMDRKQFFALAIRAAKLYASVKINASKTRRLWRSAGKEIISESFWRTYLSLRKQADA